jgi:hypothetical protein
MGATESKGTNSAEDFQNYVSQLSLVRKEHSLNLQATIDLYRPSAPKHQEELILLYEQSFNEQEGGSPELLKFKQKLEIRKKITSPCISELLYVNFQVLKGLCIEQLICRVALQYSQVTLDKLIGRRVLEGSQRRVNVGGSTPPTPDALMSLTLAMVEALTVLGAVGMNHGFIQPENILVFDSDSSNPHFKLLDVGLISKFDK